MSLWTLQERVCRLGKTAQMPAKMQTLYSNAQSSYIMEKIVQNSNAIVWVIGHFSIVLYEQI